MENNTFSERLKDLRADKQVSQYKLADDLNLSRSMISNYEQGLREPDYSTLKLLAHYFNVSIDYLLGVSEIKQPYLTPDEKVYLSELLKKVENIKDINSNQLAELLKTANNYSTILDKIKTLSETSISDLEKYMELLQIRDTVDDKKETTSSVLKKPS